MALDGPNEAAAAALNQPVLRPFYILWLDILTDPVRVTTLPYTSIINNTNDVDLDGNTFQAGSSEILSVGPVKHKEDGSDTVTITLSGQIGPDTGVMDLIGNKSNWQGRLARIWMGVLDPNLALIDVWPYYTGYMMVPKFSGDSKQQVIMLEVESYYALLTKPSGRTLLSQSEYDPGDHSADASIAVANGTHNDARNTSFAENFRLMGRQAITNIFN